MLTVAEAARNVACAGAVPIGVTNNLNFGNPERPEIMWQLVEAIEGMAEACRAFELPVTGGNVSLYNETDGKAIHPTPVVGIVGLLEDVRWAVGRAFPEAGLEIIVLGDNRGDMAGSEYLAVLHGAVCGRPAEPDLIRERSLQRLLPAAARQGVLRSANDVSAGGLAVALAEACFGAAVGAEVQVPPVAGAPVPATVAALFGEGPGVVVVSVAPSHRRAFLDLAAEHGVPAVVAGRTGGERLRVSVGSALVLDEPVVEARERWTGALEARIRPHAARG
jgi:phosphoribosylformylglycinamidine synthase